MSNKLKVWAPKSTVQSIERVHPDKKRLTWRRGESRYCEISHIVHLKPSSSNVIAEFHLTPRGAQEARRRQREEKREQKRYECYLRSVAFRRQQEAAWKAFVLSW